MTPHKIASPVSGKLRRVRVVLLAGAALLLLCVWLARTRHGGVAEGAGDQTGHNDDPGLADEVGGLRDRVRALERRVGAMQLALVQHGPPSAAQQVEKPATATAPSASAQSEDAARAAMLQRLEEQVTTETSDPGARAASENALKGELLDALSGKARLAGINCASTFCRVVLEEDANAATPLEIAALWDKAPSMRHEAMFNYEEQGTLKRTTVYVALEGHVLPLPHEPSATVPGIDTGRGL